MTRTSRLAKLAILSAALVALALATSRGGEAGTFYAAETTGYDVSFPQCGRSLPRDGSFGVVGVTNGLPWSANPCLATQYKWADSKASAPSLYMNTANPGPISKYWDRPGPRVCEDPQSYDDTGCSYNYGWNAAADAYAVASGATAGGSATNFWWLDVETVNSWNGSSEANAATLDGYMEYLLGRGVGGVGVYSTGSQWRAITGGHELPSAPNWVAGGSNKKSASRLCSSSFTGGPVWLVQYASKGFDADYVCR
jgi:hypothetical protein